MFEKLKELIAKNPDQKALIKQAAVAAIREHNGYYYTHCQICSKSLSQNEINAAGPNDFLIVCEEHKSYSGVFRADVIRKQLGYPEATKSIYETIEDL